MFTIIEHRVPSGYTQPMYEIFTDACEPKPNPEFFKFYRKTPRQIMKQLRLDNPELEFKVEILTYDDDSLRQVLCRPKRCIQSPRVVKWRHFGLVKNGELRRGGIV